VRNDPRTGAEQRIDGSGDGSIAALLRTFGEDPRLCVVENGTNLGFAAASTDAEAAAYVLLDVDGRQVPGAALDTDTLGASLKAVLSAL